MRFMRVFVMTFALISMPNISSYASGADWMDNFEKAKAKAAKEGKDLLVDFRSSNWCEGCIRLEEEVFSRDSFKAAAPKDFALVSLDFPHDKSKITREIIAQNEKLKDEYGVLGFPTIFLMDEKARPYAQTAYQEGGPEHFIAHLKELKAKRQQRDKKFAAAQASKDILKKAKYIDEGLSAISNGLLGFYVDEMEQIIKLDSQNKAGLKAKYELIIIRENSSSRHPQRWCNEAIKLADDAIAKLKPTGKGSRKYC